MSLRVGDRVWITPTRVLAQDLELQDLVAVDIDGMAVSDGSPSREAPMHLAIYHQHPDASAVVHTHSPWATAWSHLGEHLDLPTEELRYHGLRRIPCARWAPAGSQDLGREAAAALDESPVALLAEHGVVAIGSSLASAIEHAALAEQQAHIQWLLRLDGGPGALHPVPRRTAAAVP